MKHKIVHIVNNEKFIKPFIEFINDNFDSSEHVFLNLSNSNNTFFPLPKVGNVIEFKSDLSLTRNFFLLWRSVSPFLTNADKIIVHSAFNQNFNKYLYLNPIILKKAHWVLWGGDLYQPLIKPAITMKQKVHNFFDHSVKGKFAGYITYIPGDYELAKELYTAKGNYYECNMYPSNLYSHMQLPVVSGKAVTILVGNSADSTNRHEEIFDKLSKLKDKNFEIICPLSYGPKDYAHKITVLGESLFGDRFTSLMDFMPFEDYLNTLAKVDVAIFAHKRQQAMGITITLLGLGKKVYMRKDVTPYSLFQNLDVKVFDINELNLELIELERMKKNRVNIEKYFSKITLKEQWRKVFDSL